MLGLGEREPRPDDLRWGVLAAGSPLGEVTPLFPRIETKPKETPSVSDDKPQPPAPPAAADDGRIDISDFAKVELRVAQILTAEKIPGSKKLVKLQVDLGTERRQLVAGIAESYAPETLPGKKVAVVANLKPAKLMGVESNGMVLAASPGGAAVLVTFDADVPLGTKIK
jgi:methionyl-tRNA synthetase